MRKIHLFEHFHDQELEFLREMGRKGGRFILDNLERKGSLVMVRFTVRGLGLGLGFG